MSRPTVRVHVLIDGLGVGGRRGAADRVRPHRGRRAQRGRAEGRRFEPRGRAAARMRHRAALRRHPAATRCRCVSPRPSAPRRSGAGLVHTHLGYADLLGGPGGALARYPDGLDHPFARTARDDARTCAGRRLITVARRTTAARVIAVSHSARRAYLASGADDRTASSWCTTASAPPQRGAGARVRDELGVAADDLVVATVSSLRPRRPTTWPSRPSRLLLPASRPCGCSSSATARCGGRSSATPARLGDRVVLAGYRPDVMAVARRARRAAAPVVLRRASDRDDRGDGVLGPRRGDGRRRDRRTRGGRLHRDARRRPRRPRLVRGRPRAVARGCGLRRRRGPRRARAFEVEFSADRWARRHARDLPLGARDRPCAIAAAAPTPTHSVGPSARRIHRRLSVPSEMNSDAVRKPISSPRPTRTSQRGERALAPLIEPPGGTHPGCADAAITASSSSEPDDAGLRQLLEIDVVRHVRLVDDEANELQVARLADVVLRVGLEGGEADARHRVIAGHPPRRPSTAPRGHPRRRCTSSRGGAAPGEARKNATAAAIANTPSAAGLQALPASEDERGDEGRPVRRPARRATRWPRAPPRWLPSRRPVRAWRSGSRIDGSSPARQRDRRHEAGGEVVRVALPAREALTGGEVDRVGGRGEPPVAGQPDDDRDERADHERQRQHADVPRRGHRRGDDEERRRRDVPALDLVQASDRSLAHATDRVSHTSSRPSGDGGPPVPGPARRPPPGSAGADPADHEQHRGDQRRPAGEVRVLDPCQRDPRRDRQREVDEHERDEDARAVSMSAEP